MREAVGLHTRACQGGGGGWRGNSNSLAIMARSNGPVGGCVSQQPTEPATVHTHLPSRHFQCSWKPRGRRGWARRQELHTPERCPLQATAAAPTAAWWSCAFRRGHGPAAFVGRQAHTGKMRDRGLAHVGTCMLHDACMQRTRDQSRRAAPHTGVGTFQQGTQLTSGRPGPVLKVLGPSPQHAARNGAYVMCMRWVLLGSIVGPGVGGGLLSPGRTEVGAQLLQACLATGRLL